MARVRQAVKCKAHREKDGEPCTLWAMQGQLVCWRHGGRTPQALEGARRRKAETTAAKVLARLDVQPVGNALVELARIAGQCVAWKDACADMVNKLRADEIRYSGREGGALTEQVRAELLLWERALDRCVVALSAMARLNLDERLVVIEERKAEKIAAALSEALNDAECDGDQAELVRIGFARRLRAVTAKAS